MTTTEKHSAKAKTKAPLPAAGRKKQSPKELEKILDKGIEDSMAASDPPAATQPEVHTEPDRDGTSVESDKKSDKSKI